MTSKSWTARSSWIAFVITLLVAVPLGVALRERLGPPAESGALLVLWWISVLALLLGVLTVLMDVTRLGREWGALHALDADDYLEVAQSVEPRYRGTLALSRLRAAAARGAARADARTSARSQSASASAGIGAVTRQVASALLLLTVLGTFAGMKDALPHLVAALRQGAPTTGSVTATPINTTQVAEALSRVEHAFGANFVALLGSLLLGIAAYGAVAERRRLLGELDRVADERWYPALAQEAADASALEKAVREMQLSGAQIRRVGEGIDRLSSNLDVFQTKLVDAISDMNSAFGQGIRDQSVAVQAQVKTTVEGLAANLLPIAAALQHTATLYQGLVRGLEERDLGVQEAAAAMREHAERLEQVNLTAAQTARQSASAQKSFADLTGRVAEGLARTAEGVDASARSIAEALATQREMLVGVRGELARLSEVQAPVPNRLNDLAKAIQLSSERADSTARAMHKELTERIGTSGSGIERLLETLEAHQRGLRADLAQHTDEVAQIRDAIVAAIAAVRTETAEARAEAKGQATYFRDASIRAEAAAEAAARQREQLGRWLTAELPQHLARRQPDVPPGGGQLPSSDGGVQK